MSTIERRIEVLRAIVSDYVATREPVGSRSLVERHGLKVSPATIRNDMAALEEAGLIVQPHTSAGRIPTDTGYRHFVDHLAQIKTLTAPERRAIETFLAEAVDLDDAVSRTTRLLAQLTHQVAVVQYPSLRRSALRHLELVPLGSDRVLLVIITDSGRVEQRTLTLEGEESLPEDGDLALLRVQLNVAAAGERMPALQEHLDALVDELPHHLRELARMVTGVVIETLLEEGEDRIVMAGHSNLTRSTYDFDHFLQPVLEALEEQVVLMNLLAEVAAEGEESSDVAVRIGAEIKHSSLVNTSLVAAPYGAEGGPDHLAFLGVLGPTRMDYPATMAAVRAVARYLSRLVAPQE